MILNARNLAQKPWPKNTTYIGRNQQLWNKAGEEGFPILGNPFVMKEEKDRSRVIQVYRGYLPARLLDEKFAKTFWKVKGNDLVCHCAPKACHGHVMQQVFDQNKTPEISPQQHLRFVCDAANKGLAQQMDPEHPLRQALRALSIHYINNGSLVKQNQIWTTKEPAPACPDLEIPVMREAAQRMTQSPDTILTDLFADIGARSHNKSLEDFF